eukprot:SAG22_NODE_1445_length_4406_cov_7.808684_3_plen_111_part_00
MMGHTQQLCADTILRALIGDDFGQTSTSSTEMSNAYAYVGFVNAVASTVGYLVGPSFGLKAKARILLGCWAVAFVAAFIALHPRCVAAAERQAGAGAGRRAQPLWTQVPT